MTSTSIHRRIISGMIAVAAILVLGGADLMAQRFQSVFGGPTCREAARYGVKQLAGGGYIAVGESYSATASCGTSDIYVVRTDANGILLWSFTYNIAPFDSATDVIETPTGDFVICGVTGPTTPVGCGNGRDAFLLKINSAGAFIDVQKYGSPADEIAWNLVEANTGDGVTTNPGDYIVAGATLATGISDGYIFRTDANLNLIWAQRYDAGGFNGPDLFYGVVEVVPPTGTPGPADIAAVGYSIRPTTAGARQVFVVRVSGANGSINAATHGAALYGGALDDEGRAIIEVQAGGSADRFIIAGISRNRPAPSGSDEILMLEIGPHPCTFINASYSGNDGTTPDGAIDLKENIFSPTAAREVIVTGYTSLGNATITGLNVFLQRYLTGALTLVGGGMAYGGNGEDVGWSVNIATNASTAPPQTQGFVVAGYTRSANLIGAADPEQMYLIKTNTALSSNCNNAAIIMSQENVQLSANCITTIQAPVGIGCIPLVTPTVRTWGTQLCYITVGTKQQNNGSNDGVSGVESPAVISFSEGTVRSYPNPLASGQPLNLRFELAASTPAEIIVSDIIGRVVHQEQATIEAGSAIRVVDTDGWGAGAYQISVKIGGKMKTTRVVVMDN